MKKVLLCYCSLNGDGSQLSEHTGLFYLAGALERRGYQPYVFHGPYSEFYPLAENLAPDALGFSCDSENQAFYTHMIPSVRKFYENKGITNLPVVVGGPQATGLDKNFLTESGADYILTGEGEETLPDLMDAVFLHEKKLDDILGLYWFKNGVFQKNPGIGLVRDLDTLPRPAYHASLHKLRHYGRVVFTGRGCPFSCSFCASSVTHVTPRLRAIDDVLQEIRENLARDPDMKNLIIQDDTFCLNTDRVRSFCAGMREIRKVRPVVWFCETHIRTILHDPELLSEMVDSGLVRMQVGMESGDPEVLLKYGKRITPDDMLQFVRLAAETGLPQIAANFIVGGPEEKEGVTENLIRQLLREGAGIIDINTSFLHNYPGTAITQTPASFGLEPVMPDGMTAGDDYPSMVPQGLDAAAVIRQRQDLNRTIRAEMGALIENRQVPVSRLIRQAELLQDYSINSRWMMEAAQRPEVLEYLKTIACREGEPFHSGIDPCHCYPQRTFEFYRTVITLDGIPRIRKAILTPLEYDVLFYSSGKLSVAEIAQALLPSYADGYPDEDAMIRAVVKTLEEADHRYWVTMFVF